MAGPRPKFDPKRPLVAAREFTFMGQTYKPGQPFAPEGVADRLRARQYESRAVNFGEGEATADAPSADPVQMTGPSGGRYTITAPWLVEPEVVRGKVNAEKRLAEIKEEGAPLGFIEGGTAVDIEHSGGGWYEVQAPWMDEPEKVQGREAAEARQRELHDAGEPDSHHGYTLTAGENGWWKITKDGVEAPEGAEGPPTLNVQGEEQARADVAALRAGEMIEGSVPEAWTTQPDDGEGTGGEGSDVETGGGATEETTVDDTNKDNDLNERKPEDGDKPNEPGTNQPNGAEVINDHKVAEGETDGEDGEGEGSTRPVGP